MSERVLIVGAGVSGATLARDLAEAGLEIVVSEARGHVGGNCHTERDAETGVMVHVYGPHCFHTNDETLWEYVQRFADFMPYRHKVKTVARGKIYTLPINLHTINQYFETAMRPDEARAFLTAQSVSHDQIPHTFESLARSSVGTDLYSAFFEGYTTKQWGCAPRDLPASVFKRLPLRFDYEDGYFVHQFQGQPRDGFTAMTAKMLDHANITLRLDKPIRQADIEGFGHVFYTGTIDSWFEHSLGYLSYRTLDFVTERVAGDYQGCAVINAADLEVPWTRVTEHRHLSPWETPQASVISTEYSRAAQPGDIPYYPVRLAKETKLLAQYVALAEAQKGITFVGRLGTYRYLDMDMAIREARATAGLFLRTRAWGQNMPVFVQNPLE